MSERVDEKNYIKEPVLRYNQISYSSDMTSFTVAFSGTESVLRADFFPEITLDANARYCCGLLDFTSYNSIPNISATTKNNEFKFKYVAKEKKKDSKGKEVTVDVSKEKTIALPTGAYEVDDILKYLKQELATISINLTHEISVATSKVRLSFDQQIEWISGSVLDVIGFRRVGATARTFKGRIGQWSDDIVRITNTDIIRVECDIVSGSYINGKHCHTIHQFSNCKVRPGYKFIEVPQHIIYLPIKERQQLRTIQISIVNQDGDLIDFRGEQISCRIHIKKIEDNSSNIV